MFKVYMCYINESKQLLESFDDNLKAIKFTFDLKANGLGLIKLTENSQPSHLLIEEYEEIRKFAEEREKVFVRSKRKL